MRIKSGLAISAAIAFVIAGAGVVGAKPLPVTPSSITIDVNFSKGGFRGNGSGLSFDGKVQSRKAKCRRNRQVILYAGESAPVRRTSAVGRRAPRGFTAINVVRTDRRGNWVVADPVLPRSWDGRALARTPRKRGHNVRCASARSETINLGR